MNKWLEFIIEFLPFMILAVLGGIANLIIKSDEDKQDYTIKFILGEIFLALFASVLVVFTLKEFGAGEYQIGIACGLTGLGARRILVVLRMRFLEKIKNIK